MYRRCATIALLVLVCGCVGRSKPLSVAETAWQHVDSWANMGAQLPDAGQVAFFQSHLTETRDVLASALSHPQDCVRQRAAYVIGEMRGSGRVLGPELLARLKIEPDRLVRMYLCAALRDTRFGDPEVVEWLSRRYQKLDDRNVPPAADFEYADVDEKIDTAAALWVLADETHRDEYLAFVLQWLSPPDDALTGDYREGYWERRWLAVIVLEYMPGATAAIPPLEAMLREKDAKPWVSCHVPRVLQALREGPTEP